MFLSLKPQQFHNDCQFYHRFRHKNVLSHHQLTKNQTLNENDMTEKTMIVDHFLSNDYNEMTGKVDYGYVFLDFCFFEVDDFGNAGHALLFLFGHIESLNDYLVCNTHYKTSAHHTHIYCSLQNSNSSIFCNQLRLIHHFHDHLS
jgi:hypothetical protein